MRLISVNVGQIQEIQNAKPSRETGIYKRAVTGPVQVKINGIAGDEISDTSNHGGVDQAVYVYGSPDYAWWSERLGRELLPGTFGENLTITELESARARMGDRIHIGSVILEVTAPRIPCATLAARMGDPSFARRFREAERPGLYCRVVREGYVQSGDSVTLQSYPGEKTTAIEMFRDFFEADLDEATLRRHLATPIAIRARAEYEKRLEKLLAKEAANSHA